jgi:hypothetical protein
MTEEAVEGSPEGARPNPSRRGFLAGAAGLTGVALAVASWETAFAADAPTDPSAAAAATTAAAVGRGSFDSKVSIKIGGASAGFLLTAEGGNPFADVVNEKVGPDHLARKHIAGVKYEDITVSVGAGMSKAFYDWVGTSIGGAGTPLGGSIVVTDFNLKIRSQGDFFNALITEVGMPALDAASKDAAKMTIKFAPELTRRVTKTEGSIAAQKVAPRWLVSNYKLSIDGLDTTRVVKIDGITIKQDFTPNADGAPQLFEVAVPNLKLSVLESHADAFWKWHTDFVVNGNNSSETEKKGSLSFLAVDHKTELFRLDFTGLGIFALDPDPLPGGASRKVTAQLYCDKMVFSAPAVKI